MSAVNYTLRTQFKFLSHFEANQGGNGLDQASTISEKSPYRSKMAIWAMTKSCCDLPLVLLDNPLSSLILLIKGIAFATIIPLSYPQCVSLTSRSESKLRKIMSEPTELGNV